MSAAKKIKKLAIPDRKSLEKALKKMGTLSRDLSAIRAEMDEKAAAVIRPYLKKIQRLEAQIEKLDADAVEYCKVFRADLLQGAKGKTAKLPTGSVQFKKDQDKVVFEMDEHLIITRLYDARFDDAIRTKHSVDKRYVLRHPEIAEEIDGLTIQEGEEKVVLKPTSIS